MEPVLAGMLGGACLFMAAVTISFVWPLGLALAVIATVLLVYAHEATKGTAR